MQCPTIDQLRSLLDATAGDARAVELQLHLESCESCQRALDALVADGGFWNDAAKQLADKPAITPALQEAVEHLQVARGIGFQPVDSAETKSGEEVPVAGGRKNDRLEAYPTEGRPLDYYEHALPFVGPPVEPGTIGRLKHYDILHVAGRGGMGVVVKAFDRALRRVVAIKLLAPHLASNGLARQRFVREGRATAAIAHEHVVTIHAVEEQPPFLVMQYVQGETLQARLDRCGPLELKEVLRVGKQIAEGLAAAHEQGVVHRDIKPANILLENGISRVKLTDFGLARAMDDASLTHSGVVAGTPQFMAPEQANGDAIDHRADLFSLGSVLYTMCAGHAPFRGSTAMGVLRRVAEHSARPVREINPEIPEWLAALINRLHAKRPEDRPQAALEVADELGRRLASLQSARTATESTTEKPVAQREGEAPAEPRVNEEDGSAGASPSRNSSSRIASEFSPLPGVPGRGGQDFDRQSSIAAKIVRKPTGFVMPDRLTLCVLALVIASTVMVAAGALGRVASEMTAVAFIGATLIGLTMLGIRWLFSTRVRAYLPQTIAGCLFWLVAWLAPGVLAALFIEDRIGQAAFRLRLGGEIPAVVNAANQAAQFALLAALGSYLLVTSLWFRRREPQGGPVFSKKQRVSGWFVTSGIIGAIAVAYSLIWNETVSAIARAETMRREAVAQAEHVRAAQKAKLNSTMAPLQVEFPKFADGVSVRLSHSQGNLMVNPGGRAESQQVPIGSVNWTAFVMGRSYASGAVTVVRSQLPKYPPARLKVPSPALHLLQGSWLAVAPLTDFDPNTSDSIDVRDHVFEFEQNFGGQRDQHRFSMHINPLTNPIEIDLTDFENPAQSLHGLLTFEALAPKLALRSASQKRPTSFGPFAEETADLAPELRTRIYNLIRVRSERSFEVDPFVGQRDPNISGEPSSLRTSKNAMNVSPHLEPDSLLDAPDVNPELDVQFAQKDGRVSLVLSRDGRSSEELTAHELRARTSLESGLYQWTAKHLDHPFASGEIKLSPLLPGQKRLVIEVPKPTYAKLAQGRWMLDVTHNGENPLDQSQFEVVDDAVLIATRDRRRDNEFLRKRFTIKFDESTSPVSVDLTDANGQRRRGIAVLDRSSLRMCFAVGDGLRPIVFGRDYDRNEDWQLHREEGTTRLEEDLPVEPLTAGAAADVIVSRQREHAKRLKLATSRSNKVGVELVLLPECAVTEGDINPPGLATIKWPDLTPVEAAPREPFAAAIATPRRGTNKIGPLAISASPITVKQFLQFVAETKYETEAERGAAGSWVLSEDRKLSLKPKTNWRSHISAADHYAPISDEDFAAEQVDIPVSHLSWNDARAFCEWLSNKEGRQYRLPMSAELLALSQLTLKSPPAPLQPKPDLQPDPFGPPDLTPQPKGQVSRLLGIDWFGRQARSSTPLKPVVEATVGVVTTSILEAEWTQTIPSEDGFRTCIGLGIATSSDGSKKGTANASHIAEPTFRCERLGFRVVAEVNVLRAEEPALDALQ